MCQQFLLLNQVFLQVKKLSSTLVDLFEQIVARFSVDEYRHYIFTPRDLTQWGIDVVAISLRHVLELLVIDLWFHTLQCLVCFAMICVYMTP